VTQSLLCLLNYEKTRTLAATTLVIPEARASELSGIYFASK